jgi:hypothetical protein
VNLHRYVNNSSLSNYDMWGYASNPASQFACCKSFDLFYNMVPGVDSSMSDWTKASTCRNYLLSDVWWNNVETAAIMEAIETALALGSKSTTVITVPIILNPPMGTSIVVTTLTATIGEILGAIALGGAIGATLGYALSVAYAEMICNAYVCKEYGGTPKCCSVPGYLCGKYWECRCPSGQEIYQPNDTGRYTFNPSLGNPYRYSTWS